MQLVSVKLQNCMLPKVATGLMGISSAGDIYNFLTFDIDN